MKTIIKTLLISSLFLFPTQGYAHDYVNVADSQLPVIVTCYKEHTDVEYKIDRTSIYKPDDSHMNVLVYKYINDDLISRAIYQYQYHDKHWYVLVHHSNLPDVIRVNSKGKVENITGNLTWQRADLFEELDAILRVSLSYKE